MCLILSRIFMYVSYPQPTESICNVMYYLLQKINHRVHVLKKLVHHVVQAYTSIQQTVHLRSY